MATDAPTPRPAVESPAQRRIRETTERALSQRMTIRPHTNRGEQIGEKWLVHSESGETYIVDLADPFERCTCPASEYEDTGFCKHFVRVTLEQRFGLESYPLLEHSHLVTRDEGGNP